MSELTGYPSIDKPWLKYYTQETVNLPLPRCTIWEYVSDSNRDNLDAVAVVYYGRLLTYGALFSETQRVAAALTSLGVRTGDTVTIATINTLEAIELFLAINMMGAVANLVYATESASEMSEHVRMTGSRVLFVLDNALDTATEVVRETDVEKVVIVSVTRSMSLANRVGARFLKGLGPKHVLKDGRFMDWDSFISLGEDKVHTAHDPDALAAINYTGGTTGGTKGVMLTNAQIIAVAAQYIAGEDGLHSGDVWLQVLPYFIAYGLSCSLLIPLAAGMRLVVRLPMADRLSALCKRFKPDHIIYGPVFWEGLADDNVDLDLSNLVTCVTGGDAIRPEVERKVNSYLERCGAPLPLLNGYGMTEVGAAVSVNLHRAHRQGSVGIPFPKTTISAFDPETGTEVPCGEEGELCISGPSVMSGYLGDKAATEALIRRHSDGLLWVHTGDIGHVDVDGFVYVSGRMKRYLLRIRGGIQSKVFALDIERALLKHPLVLNCAVVPRDVPGENQVPVAYVIPKQGIVENGSLVGELRTFCEGQLDGWHCPVEYLILDEFPLTKVGKVDYRKLERRAAS